MVNDVINILMSVNKKFLKYSEEMIFSLLHYSTRPINLYMMYQEKELNREDLEYLSKFVENTNNGKFIPLKFDTSNLEGVRVNGEDGYFFSIETYSRLFCGFYLPKDVEKILYLDADMVCAGDISELYDISLDGNMWAGAIDGGATLNDLQRLGLPETHQYVNAGVAIINVKKLREKFSEIDIINPIKANYEKWIYLDQDFVNKVFHGDIKIISNKYNFLTKIATYEDLKCNPIVFHYAGSIKPWDDNVTRFYREFVEPYYEALRLQGNEKNEKLQYLLEKHKEYGYKN